MMEIIFSCFSASCGGVHKLSNHLKLLASFRRLYVCRNTTYMYSLTTPPMIHCLHHSWSNVHTTHDPLYTPLTDEFTYTCFSFVVCANSHYICLSVSLYHVITTYTHMHDNFSSFIDTVYVSVEKNTSYFHFFLINWEWILSVWLKIQGGCGGKDWLLY